MNIIDISWPLSQDITGYKNRKEITFTHQKTFHQEQVRHSSITINSHAGTHVDAPSHFLKDGFPIEQYKLEQLIGPCRLLDMTNVAACITKNDLLESNPQKDEIILLKTSNSIYPTTGPFQPSFVYLEKSGAQFLAERQIKAVGIDYLGIERDQPDRATHVALLEKTIPIVEGLRFAHVKPGHYTFFCLPLAIHGLEAAPARAILIP